MKQLKKFLCGILSAAVLIISVSVPVMAAEELTDDKLFMLHHDGAAQDVWIQHEEFDSEQHAINTQISGDVIIPSKIKGYDVTGIDTAGFSYCPNIKSITIPDTVKTIGHSAFNNCTGLEKVTLPSSVTAIGDYAFAECKSLQEIVIPDSVTSIGEGAFAGCENLGAVQLSDNIIDIPELAFTAIGWMPEIKIPKKVKVIEQNAFLNTSLDNVYIPKSVTEIQDNAFSDYIFKTVYYEGTEADWQKLKISTGNESLLSAKREYSAYNPRNNKEDDAPNVTEAPKNNGAAADNKEISVYIDGKHIAFDVPPQIINDRTMVPLRAIFEALGASVDWNQGTRTVTSTKGNTTIRLTIDSSTMYVNGNAVTLDSPACIINDRTLVPVRAISEAYNTNVDWNGNTRTVTITSSNTGEAVPVSYEDISTNINQIKDFINDGLYLEAMQECENVKANHTISDADTAIINDLYNSAKTKYDEYYNESINQKKQELLETFIQTAVKSHVASFKNPASAQIYSIYAGYYERSDYNEYDSGEALAVVIDSSGQNSFGGITRDETTIILDITTEQMIMDLEGYGKRIERDSVGKNAMHGMELEKEALYLQMNKQKIFQSYDVSKYFK